MQVTLNKSRENLLLYKFPDEKKKAQTAEVNTSDACVRDEICLTKHYPVLSMYYRISDGLSRKLTLYEKFSRDEKDSTTYNILPKIRFLSS